MKKINWNLYSVVVKTTLHTKTGDWDGSLSAVEIWAANEQDAISTVRRNHDEHMLGGKYRYTSTYQATCIATHPKNLEALHA
jgi:hypothetical protein